VALPHRRVQVRNEQNHLKKINGSRTPTRNSRTVVQQGHCFGPKLERKQKKRRKAERKKRIEGNSSKATGAETDNAKPSSVAEETRNTTSAGDNRARSDEGSKEDKCGDGMTAAKNRVSATQPIHYEDRQKEELLYL